MTRLLSRKNKNDAAFFEKTAKKIRIVLFAILISTILFNLRPNKGHKKIEYLHLRKYPAHFAVFLYSVVYDGSNLSRMPKKSFVISKIEV